LERPPESLQPRGGEDVVRRSEAVDGTRSGQRLREEPSDKLPTAIGDEVFQPTEGADGATEQARHGAAFRRPIEDLEAKRNAGESVVDPRHVELVNPE
jgi:hypothetical protein